MRFAKSKRQGRFANALRVLFTEPSKLAECGRFPLSPDLTSLVLSGPGGMVIPIAAKGPGPSDRSWKWVPDGIVIQTPGVTQVTSSRSFCFRHISPQPWIKYEISSTVDGNSLGNRSRTELKWARLPPLSRSNILSADPSGASPSGWTGSRFV